MIPIKTESAWKGTSDCRNCGIRDMVLFADLNEQDFGMIHSPIDDLEFRAGTILFAESTAAMGIFTLRTGMIKLVRVTPDGRQRIVRVLRAGDVVGLAKQADGGGHGGGGGFDGGRARLLRWGTARGLCQGAMCRLRGPGRPGPAAAHRPPSALPGGCWEPIAAGSCGRTLRPSGWCRAPICRRRSSAVPGSIWAHARA